jgi:hypothetical protein
MPHKKQAKFSKDEDEQKSIFDDIDAIYQNQPDTAIAIPFQPKYVANHEIQKIYFMADTINRARLDRLNKQFFKQNSHQSGAVGYFAKTIIKRPLLIKRTESLTADMLRNQESKVGTTIFGELAPNEVRREFFYDRRLVDRDNWLFYQEIAHSTGPQKVTICYEVNPKHVVRHSSHPRTKSELIEGEELRNFLTSVKLYHDLVMAQIYGNDKVASKKTT